MATLETRGKAWRVYWLLGGRGGEKQSCTFHDVEDAKQAKRVAEAHKHNIDRDHVYAAVLGIPVPEPAPLKDLLPTVQEWADVWLGSKTRIAPGQRGRYRSQLDREILPRIGHLRLDEVDGPIIAALLQELRQGIPPHPFSKTAAANTVAVDPETRQGRKDGTVTRYYSCVHALFGYAVTEGKLATNPARRTDWIRDLVADDDIGDEDHVYLTPAELEMVWREIPERWRPLVRALADSGARFSETTALDVQDVVLHPQRGEQPGISITKAWKQDDKGRWYRGSTKGRNRRFVALPRRTLVELGPLLKDRPKDALLFTAAEGGRVVHANFRTRVWLPALARARRCPVHPPEGGGRPVEPEELAGPRCGDNGGVRHPRKDGLPLPCGARVMPGFDRCGSHMEPPRDAVSTCGCLTRLRKNPTPHDLRHSHAAWLLAAGRTVWVVSRRLGHHNTTITERVYAGVLPTVDEETIEALDDMLDRELAAVVVPRARQHHPGRRPAAPRQRRMIRRAALSRGMPIPDSA